MMMIANVTVTRDGHHYRFTLERDAHVVTRDVSIPRDRAVEIVRANPDGAAVEGELSFDASPARWVWAATVEVV